MAKVLLYSDIKTKQLTRNKKTPRGKKKNRWHILHVRRKKVNQKLTVTMQNMNKEDGAIIYFGVGLHFPHQNLSPCPGH